MDCEHTKLPEFTCSRENTAGVLCGYGELIYNKEYIIEIFLFAMVKIVLMGISGLYKVHIQMKELLKYVSLTFGV